MQEYKQRPDVKLRNLLNQSNTPAIAFDDTNLILGKPSVLLGSPDGNTQINVRGVQGIDYKGQVKVLYNRLDLSKLFQGNYRAEFSALGQSSLHRLLPELNKALGITFTEQDLINVDLRLLDDGDQVLIELTARPESIAFTGFTTVLFNRRFIMLTDVVTNNAFVELKHPDPVIEGYTSAGLLTWGMDFTSIIPQLRVRTTAAYYRGNWWDYAALKNALAENFGINDWPSIDASTQAIDSVKLYETKNHPDANTDFSHVVVQTNVRTNGYSGTAFFHYNL